MTNDVAFRNAIIKIHTFQSIVKTLWYFGFEPRPEEYMDFEVSVEKVLLSNETDQREAIYQAAVISLKKRQK